MIEYIIPVRTLDQKTIDTWMRIRGETFKCDFCSHRFIAGDSFGCTYSNFGTNASGNPNTCGECQKIPFKTRLKIWNRLNEPRTFSEVSSEVINNENPQAQGGGASE